MEELHDYIFPICIAIVICISHHLHLILFLKVWYVMHMPSYSSQRTCLADSTLVAASPVGRHYHWYL